jgi:acyl carrier protein
VACEFLKRAPAQVPADTPWAELGFDSVNALQLALRVQQATGVTLDATVLWDCANIAELATHIASMPEAAAGTVAVAQGAPVAQETRPEAQRDTSPAPASEAALAALSDADAEALLLKELER